LTSNKHSIIEVTRLFTQNKTAQNASRIFLLRLCYMALNFVIAILLGRFLGAEGLGSYLFAISTVQILLIPTIFGLPQVVIRETAVYMSQGRWGKLRGLLAWSARMVLISSLLFTGLGIVGALLYRDRDSVLSQALFIAVFSLPFLAQIRIRQSVMQGLHKVVIGNVPEFIIEPALIISALVVTRLLFYRILSADLAILAYSISIVICFCIGLFMLYRILPKNVFRSNTEYDNQAWFKSALLLLWAAAMRTINVRMDSVMLGAIKGAEAVGVYAAASRATQLIAFGLFAINVAQRPGIAAAYARGDTNRLQRALTVSSRGALAVAVPVVVLYVFFGKKLLGIFGPEFITAYIALLILSIGQLINNATGSVSVVLISCHMEKETAISVAIGTAVNIVLNAMLIPVLDIVGAAIATGVSMIVWNTVMFIFVRKILGLTVGPISIKNRLTKQNKLIQRTDSTGEVSK